MSKKLWVIAAAILLLIHSCGSPFDQFKQSERDPGTVVIRIGSGVRTVAHDFSGDIDSVDITLTSRDGYPTRNGTILLPDTIFRFESVEAGSWDIRVTAKNADAVIGTGSRSDELIESGKTADVIVPVIFPPGDGTGNLSLKIRFPANLGIDYVSGFIHNRLLERVPVSSIVEGQLEATFDVQDLPAGYNENLELVFKRGGSSGTDAGMFIEAVNIWTGLTSDRWIDANGQMSEVRTFASNEFFDTNSSLSNLQFSVGSISFAPGTLTYDLGTVALPTATLLPTGALDGQYIQYRLNGGDWIAIVTGTTSAELPLDFGSNTVEILVTAADHNAQTIYMVSIDRMLRIDHTDFDPGSVTDADLATAKALHVYFEHASVGGNIFSDWYSGYNALLAADPRFTCGRVHWDTDPKTTDPNPVPPDHTWFETNTGLADLSRGNPLPIEKANYFHDTFSDSAFASTIDVASFKFCFIDSTAFYPELVALDLFNAVKAAMEELQSAYPNITFVWWTMPLETYAAPASREEYNALVRAYCAANNRWLLDIADLESHDDLGNAIRDSSNRELLCEDYATDGGHLNMVGAEKIARAYWRLIIEIGKTR